MVAARENRCTGCLLCQTVCAGRLRDPAIEVHCRDDGNVRVSVEGRCDMCLECVMVCPEGALMVSASFVRP